LQRLGGASTASVSLATLLEPSGYPVADSPYKGTFTRTLESTFKVCDPLVEIKVDWRRGCFDFEEPDWRSLICAASNAEALRLRGS
jgi:hypothetical protein